MTTQHAPIGTPLTADLLTPDLAAARAFYGPLLGWTCAEAATGSPDEAAAGVLIACTADGTPVASLRHMTTAPAPGWIVVFAGPDRAATEALVHHGGGASLRINSGTGADLYADPAGVPFAVSSAMEPATPSAVSPGPGRPAWYELMTTAPAQTEEFYATVLGLAATAPPGTDADTGVESLPFALLVVAGRPVAGRLRLPPELAAELGERWMVYFAHPDVDAAAHHALNLGATVLVQPRDTPTGRVAALRDPAGAVFTLLRPGS